MIIFSEQDFKNRLTLLINSNFANEQELVKLSQILNVTRITINRWRNKTLTPKVENLAQLAILTNTSLDYIILGNENKKLNSNIIFIEQQYKNRLTKTLSSTFKNNLDASKVLQLNNSTIGLWKKQKTSPNVKLLTKLAIFSNLSLNYIILGVEN